MSDAEPLLRVSGLRTWYPIQQGLMQRTVGWVQAATDVGFTIAPGETLALVHDRAPPNRRRHRRATASRRRLLPQRPQQRAAMQAWHAELC